MEGKNPLMIPFDFDYYRPSTLDEAHACYARLAAEQKNPRYYGGGTEIISMARMGSIEFGAVIDLKGIPECNQLRLQDGAFTIGSAQTLTNIAQSGAYPLLTDTISRIADHTIQGKITIGGNLAGSIIYREAALPLMISNCNITVMTAHGQNTMPFLQVFDGRLNLQGGEFLVNIIIDDSELRLPYNHAKRTKMTTIDYPLITLAARKNGKKIQAAISGYGDRPLLLPVDILNEDVRDTEKMIKRVIRHIGSEGRHSLTGSQEYKEFVLRHMLAQMLQNLYG